MRAGPHAALRRHKERRTILARLDLPDSRRLRWVPLVVLLVGLTATALATWLLARSEAEEDRVRFLNAVQQRHDRIAERLGAYIAMLRGVAGYLAAHREPEPYEFRAYVEALELQANYPGVQGVGYSRRVAPEMVDALERRQRRQGYEGFKVWPDRPRAEYHSIVYLEPLDRRNRAAIGYDMYSEPTRAAAMARARDTGAPAVSGRVTLVQDIDAQRQPGFLIYVPVYNGREPPRTVAERRDRLDGFAYSPLRADDLFKGIFGTEAAPMVAFAIYDGPQADPMRLLYRSAPWPEQAPRFATLEAFQVGGHTWTVEYRALPAFESVSGSALVPVALFVGIVLSLLLAGLSFMQAHAHAAYRTSVRALQDYREAVRHQQKLYRLAIEQVRDYAIFLVSPEGAMSSWNGGVEKVFGWGEGEFVGQPVEITFPDEDKRCAEEELRIAREQHVARNDRWQVRKDGTRFWASGITNALYDEQGRFVGYLKVMRDLTESRVQQQRIEAQEQQLRLITDTLPVLIAYIDAEQRYRFVNRVYGEWLGLPAERVLERRIQDVVDAEVYAQLREYVERALAGEAVQYTSRLTLGGQVRDLAHTYSPDRDAQGRVVGFAAMVEDIGARKRAEERATTILESITDAFFTVDREWRVSYVNRLAERIMNRTARGILGRTLWELFPALHGTSVEAAYRAAMDRQTPLSFEWQVAPDGLWLDVRAYPSDDGLSVYLRDITAQKRAEAERARQASTLAFMLELNELTRPLVDPEEIAAATARLLGEHLGISRCAYAEFDADEEHFTITGDYHRDVPSIVGRYTLSSFGSEIAGALRAGRIHVRERIDDAESVSAGAVHLGTEIKAYVAVPLHKGGRLVAAMAVHHREPRKWSKAEIELVRLVAARCWEALERARVERNLRESEERFRQMANSISQLAWIARPDGHMEWFNQRWYDYTGTTPEQMAHEGWHKLLHPEMLQDVLEAYEAAITEGEPFEKTCLLRGADGRYREFLSRAEPVRDAAGRIVQWFGTCTDMSGARDAEARFRAVVETTPECVKIIARDGTIRYMNGAGLAMLGASGLEEVQGRSLPDFLVPEHRAAWWRQHARVCEGEKLVWQFEFLDADGSRHWVETHAVPIVMADGQVAHLGMTRDISTAKRVEREREQVLAAERAAREEAERVVRMKDEFLATLSHELRTPLSAMLGWAQLLRRRKLSPEDTAAGLEAIERNAKAQQKLIEDLLDMSRIVSGKVHLDVQPLRLPEVLHAALDVVRPMADAKRISIERDVELDVPALNGDPGRLQQVLWNLLTNAIKFTPAGGRVRVTLRQEGSELMVSVADNGSGIPSSFLPFIFDRFRQFDSSTTRKHGGLGLGLSIVKSLVEMHGGRIRAESPGEGQGATFTVHLPIPAVASTPAPQRESADAAQPADAVSESEAPSLAGLKVLIVDDEPDARMLLRRILAEYDAEVLVASNADEGLECLKRARPQLVVSDIGMPGKDGYRFISEVRALPPDAGGRTPAIALTAFAREEDRRRALMAGFQLHIAKPVDPVALVLACARIAEVADGASRGSDAAAKGKRTD